MEKKIICKKIDLFSNCRLNAGKHCRRKTYRINSTTHRDGDSTTGVVGKGRKASHHNQDIIISSPNKLCSIKKNEIYYPLMMMFVLKL